MEAFVEESDIVKPSAKGSNFSGLPAYTNQGAFSFVPLTCLKEAALLHRTCMRADHLNRSA
jgi:hypothetical protein